MTFSDELSAAKQKGGILNTGNGSVRFNTGMMDFAPAYGGYSGIPASGGQQVVRYASPDDPIYPDKPIGADNPTWGDYDVWLKVNNPQSYVDLRKTMKAAGYSSWSSVLKGAAYTSAPINDFLAEQAQAHVGTGGAGSGGPFNNTTTNISLSSLSQAQATGTAAYQSELGRSMGADEAKTFQQALNEQQRANPSITSQRGVTSGRSTTSTTTSTTGFDPTAFAQKYARSQSGYAERYAGSKFMDILDKAISDPNSIDQIIKGGQ